MTNESEPVGIAKAEYMSFSAGNRMKTFAETMDKSTNQMAKELADLRAQIKDFASDHGHYYEVQERAHKAELERLMTLMAICQKKKNLSQCVVPAPRVESTREKSASNQTIVQPAPEEVKKPPEPENQEARTDITKGGFKLTICEPTGQKPVGFHFISPPPKPGITPSNQPAPVESCKTALKPVKQESSGDSSTNCIGTTTPNVSPSSPTVEKPRPKKWDGASAGVSATFDATTPEAKLANSGDDSTAIFGFGGFSPAAASQLDKSVTPYEPPSPAAVANNTGKFLDNNFADVGKVDPSPATTTTTASANFANFSFKPLQKSPAPTASTLAGNPPGKPFMATTAINPATATPTVSGSSSAAPAVPPSSQLPPQAFPTFSFNPPAFPRIQPKSSERQTSPNAASSLSAANPLTFSFKPPTAPLDKSAQSSVSSTTATTNPLPTFSFNFKPPTASVSAFAGGQFTPFKFKNVVDGAEKAAQKNEDQKEEEDPDGLDNDAYDEHYDDEDYYDDEEEDEDEADYEEGENSRGDENAPKHQQLQKEEVQSTENSDFEELNVEDDEEVRRSESVMASIECHLTLADAFVSPMKLARTLPPNPVPCSAVFLNSAGVVRVSFDMLPANNPKVHHQVYFSHYIYRSSKLQAQTTARIHYVASPCLSGGAGSGPKMLIVDFGDVSCAKKFMQGFQKGIVMAEKLEFDDDF